MEPLRGALDPNKSIGDMERAPVSGHEKKISFKPSNLQTISSNVENPKFLRYAHKETVFFAGLSEKKWKQETIVNVQTLRWRKRTLGTNSVAIQRWNYINVTELTYTRASRDLHILI
jgi:hypothetical protein